jgi:hypothetical protein
VPPWWFWPLAYIGGLVAGLVQFMVGAYLAIVVMGVKDGEGE